MKKGLGSLFVGVFLLVLALQIVSAVSTEVNIKTMPNQEVEMAVSDGTISDFSLLDHKHLHL